MKSFALIFDSNIGLKIQKTKNLKIFNSINVNQNRFVFVGAFWIENGNTVYMHSFIINMTSYNNVMIRLMSVCCPIIFMIQILRSLPTETLVKSHAKQNQNQPKMFAKSSWLLFA